MTGTETQTIKELNPELLQNYTPPGENRFRVKLPAGNGATAELLQQEESNLNGKLRQAALVVHEVRRGDTLLSIARRYGQEVRMLMELNGLKSSYSASRSEAKGPAGESSRHAALVTNRRVARILVSTSGPVRRGDQCNQLAPI